MQAGTVTDSRSGQKVEIKFDVKTDEVWVNGQPAKRMQIMESDENEVVLGIPVEGITAKALFHILKDDIKALPNVD